MRFFLSLFMFLAACQETPVEKGDATPTPEFGGMVLFGMEGNNVMPSYTKGDGEVEPIIQKKPCTLAEQRCVWEFGRTRRIRVVFRPDGKKLEDADVRVYAGKKRLAAILAWEPPHNSMGIQLAVDTNENNIRCRKKPQP